MSSVTDIAISVALASQRHDVLCCQLVMQAPEYQLTESHIQGIKGIRAVQEHRWSAACRRQWRKGTLAGRVYYAQQSHNEVHL